jgi:release factor glutamine methyltransferase
MSYRRVTKQSDWRRLAWMFSELADFLAQAQLRLSRFSATASLDAQVLAAQVLGKTRSWVLAHPQARLTASQAAALETALARLEAGTPLPYLLGHWEFLGLDFFLTPAVLIPRPETELLVEQALDWLARRAGQPVLGPHQGAAGSVPGQRWPLAIDLGTGSGCIAVTLAHCVPELRVVATDISADALAVARVNASRYQVESRLHFLLADLLTPFACQAVSSPGSAPFDLICANLPYIPTRQLHILEVYGKEPVLALDGGPDGLDLIRRLLLQARLRLAPGGCLLCEIEAGQGKAGLHLAQMTFPQAQVQLLTDLQGHDRLIQVQL